MPMMLLLAALSDFGLAALHAGIIAAGAPAYRFFRAGETYARAAEAGEPWPARNTAVITAVFALWGLCTLSAAGVGPRVPFVEWAVALIAAVFVARGLALAPQLAGRRVFTAGQPVEARDLIFSTAALVIGAAHGVGLWTIA